MSSFSIITRETTLGIHSKYLQQISSHLPNRRRTIALHQQQKLRQSITLRYRFLGYLVAKQTAQTPQNRHRVLGSHTRNLQQFLHDRLNTILVLTNRCSPFFNRRNHFQKLHNLFDNSYTRIGV